MEIQVGNIVRSPWTNSYYLLLAYDPQTDCFDCHNLELGETTFFTYDMLRWMKQIIDKYGKG
jgi:hypothetical protein